MRISARYAAIATATLVIQGCSLFKKPASHGSADAGGDAGEDSGMLQADSGDLGDGGTPADSGSSLDGGMPIDGGTTLDGGDLGDGGATEDGGTPMDGGMPTDGGTPIDAGMDAGSRMDAGPPPDGGPNGVFVDTMAGNGMPGNVSGTGNAFGASEFSAPSWVALDTMGHIYVSDTGNNSIRKIVVGMGGGFGTVPFAGTGLRGSADGMAAMATFSQPAGIATNAAGTIFIADKGNNAIRTITFDAMSDALVATLSGGPDPGFMDGPAAVAKFNSPTAVVVDPAGNVFVADTGNNAIRQISPGGMVTTYAGPSPSSATPGMSGFKDGAAVDALFNAPTGLAVDSHSNVYVADSLNFRVRSISFGIVTTLAGNGTAGFVDGAGGISGNAEFNVPMGVALDSFGKLYVGDSMNARLRIIDPVSGGVTTIAGDGTAAFVDGAGGPFGDAEFVSPTGVAFLGSGRIIVADAAANRVRIVTGIHSGGPYTQSFAGNGAIGFNDGTGGPFGTAELNSPRGLATDKAGNTYVVDSANDTIRKIDPFGNLTTVAGSRTLVPDAGYVGGYLDGPALMAKFNLPTAVAVDGPGNIYVADNGNHRLRKIDTTGNVTTMAGNGNSGFPDGTGGPNGTAEFGSLNGLAVDSHGTVYVVDAANERIRLVDSSGNVRTLAGSGIAGKLNGPGGEDSVAQFNNPQDIVLDSAGNAYVTDFGNNVIRRIDPSGNVTTFAGAGMAGDGNGFNLTATFTGPTHIAIDGAGNLFITDADNYIRMITLQAGLVSTIAGTGAAAVVNGVAANAQFTRPYGIAVDLYGDLVVSDFAGNDVRLILQVASP